jgi:hypothetical protein
MTADLRQILTAVEHDLRGIASVVAGQAKLLAGHGEPTGDGPTALELLQRAATRLEQLALDANALADWGAPRECEARQWRVIPIGPLVDSAAGETGTIERATGSREAWRRRLVRVSSDGAFEDALGVLWELAQREADGPIGCRGRVDAGDCEIYFGSPPGIDWAARRDAGTEGRDVRFLVASTVLAAHGATVWRGPNDTGIGVSVPLAATKLPAP